MPSSPAGWLSPAPTCPCRSAARCSCCGRSKGHSPGNYRNFQRIAVLASLSGTVLARSAPSPTGATALLLWAIALAIEYSRPVARLLDARPRRVLDVRLGRGRRPPCRALRAVRDHRARRVGAGDGRDLRQAGLDARDHRRVSHRCSRAAWRCGGSTSTLVRSVAAGTSRNSERPRPPGPAVLHLHSHRCWWLGLSWWRSATSWCWHIPRATPTLKTALVLLGGPVLYLAGNHAVQTRQRQTSCRSRIWSG